MARATPCSRTSPAATGRIRRRAWSLSGSTLYGTTTDGGSSGDGTVFKVNTDGTGYTVLKNFTGSDGAYPYAGRPVGQHALWDDG